MSESPQEIMRRYPRITAHIIAESLGYATPTKARPAADHPSVDITECDAVWAGCSHTGGSYICLGIFRLEFSEICWT